MSPLRSILVHVDTSPQAAVRLAQADALAEAHVALATAFYAATPFDLQYPFGMSPALQTPELAMDLESSRRARARAQFDAALAAGRGRLRWAELAADQGLPAFNRRALYADLLVLGQHDPRPGSPADVPADFVEWTLNDTGKPALVLPCNQQQVLPLRTALVAWKDSREAARALVAALPLLRQARQVHVALWSDGLGTAAPADGLAVQAYLRTHGIAAQLHLHGPASRELGEHLLSLSADLSADLLVMGCYGHARIREWVTGGVTRTVMASMTVPVLFSH